MTASSLHDLIQQALLWRATALAHRGAFDEAEAVLHGHQAAGVAASPAGLDLLARIRAQQGRHTDAAALWTRAAAAAGDETLFAAHRAHADRRRSRSGLAVASLIAVAGVVAVGFALGWRGGWTPGGTSIVQTRAVAAGPPSPAATEPQLPVVIEPVRLRAVDGVALTVANDVTIATFNRPVFEGGARLTREAAGALAAMAQALTDADANVEIVGFADAVPLIRGTRYASNTALAMARAARVFDAMVRGGVSHRRIALTSGGIDAPLTREVGLPGARRTVELRITSGRRR